MLLGVGVSIGDSRLQKSVDCCGYELSLIEIGGLLAYTFIRSAGS